jgi:hypothetical protein
MPRGLMLIGGALLGGLLGFLARPTVPFVGQLPFSIVVTRGSNLTGLDVILKSVAEDSFNDMVIGTIVGGIAGVVVAALKRPAAVSVGNAAGFCSNCGGPFPAESEFCGKCGARR